MRTDHPTSGAASAVPLRSQFQRARRALAAQGPVVRWPLGLAALGLLFLGAYWAAPSAPALVFLRAGEPFSIDAVSRVRPAFEAKRIPFRVDDLGRIEVRSDREAEAVAALNKLGVGARSIADIINDGNQSSLIEGISEKDARLRQMTNLKLAEMVRRLDDSGIISALVDVRRLTARGGLRPVVTTTVFVYLETEKNRPISFPTVKNIQDLIVAAEPEVKHDAVTVLDQTGRRYLDAYDPNVSRETRLRAREEDLTARITKQLDHVKGIRVTVQLVAPPPQADVPPPQAPPAEEVEPRVSVNQPAELEEPKPPRSRATEAAPAPPLAPARAPAAPQPIFGGEQVRVWVKIPSSYYLKMKPNHEPSAEELRVSLERTERLIKRAVGLVLPPETTPAPEVFVDTIPDHHEATPAPLPAVVSEPRLGPEWWAVGGAAGGVVTMLLAVGYRMATARRPAPRPPAAEFGRFKVDAASEPRNGPSERVRELIRLNPEAAASVLQRWTGQGGLDE